MHPKYDSAYKMLTYTLNGYNYHTDAVAGEFHHVRSSFTYAVMLLDLGDKQYRQRAFDVIDKTISLQDQDTASKSCGVWPYYLEEPLATKKSPIDFNWADFNAVSLLDVWMGHNKEIPAYLKPRIKNALILAAKSIEKRNMGPGYTNIAIMGTYVTYMVSHLFNLPEMQSYARKRLQTFFDYTIEKGGFSEYNSPTYTIVALDELYRMKLHIKEPSAKKQVDSLYSIGWEMIARHYHKPTAQWTGPHSRSYSTLVRPSFYAILKEASGGKIITGLEEKRPDVKIKHTIPAHLMPYFLNPVYPRTEKDIFEKDEPQTRGTSYMTSQYALSTANRSSLWNQRRPFLLYWGTPQMPKYLQIRFLHDNYDFSSATFFSDQRENKVLAGINFITTGGDKHITIDRLKEGTFIAKDLRLRFELGNVPNIDNVVLPQPGSGAINLQMDGLSFEINLFRAEIQDMDGYWVKGGDGTNSWLDFVFYSGQEKAIDLTKLSKALMALTFVVNSQEKVEKTERPNFEEKNGLLNASWEGLFLSLPIVPVAVKNVFI